jgi:succinyl-CoA synthetase beta subunit
MKIYEFQAMALLEEYAVPVLPYRIADTPEGARDAAREFCGSVVVKAQVLTGGRGKAGGIKFADSEGDVYEKAREIFSVRIKGIPVKKVLVGNAVPIRKEYYLGITIDTAEKKIVYIISECGGIDIEETAARQPEMIKKHRINPVEGIDSIELERFLAGVFPNGLVSQAYDTAVGMYRLFRDKDCALVEINPFAVTDGDRLVALDAKMVFDDNGLFKHPEIEELKNLEEYSEDEITARKAGLSFVGLDGDIGCIVNGAGLAMATMDIIKLLGGKPANFLDVGGSSSPDKVYNALKVLLKNERIKAILINIFGGLTRCDDIAEGILMTMERIDIPVPLVIRLIGTNEKQGRESLKKRGLATFDELTAAVREVINQAYGTAGAG